jgi:hypothetical protein
LTAPLHPTLLGVTVKSRIALFVAAVHVGGDVNRFATSWFGGGHRSDVARQVGRIGQVFEGGVCRRCNLDRTLVIRHASLLLT